MALSESDKRPYPPSTDDYKGKLCVISLSGDDNSIYILDFNSADADASTEFIDLPPALRFLGIFNFCVLDTQLYVIGAYDVIGADDVIGAEDGGMYFDTKKLWMCKYNLDSPSPPPNSLIDSTELSRCGVSDMKASKWSPEVVPTPDGRILVYSKYILYASSEGIDVECADFEVYDPKLNQWEKLPQLHLLLSWGDLELRLLDKSGNWITLPGLLKIRNWNRYYAVTTYGFFINGSSTFILTLQMGVMFALNFDSLEEGWQVYDDPFINGDGDEFVVAEPFVVTPHWVKDRRRMGRDDKQMIPHFLPPDDITHETSFRWPRSDILLLNYVKGRECFTCTLNSGYRREREGYSPFFICTILKHDIAAATDGDGDGGALIPLDSFKYRLIVGEDTGCSIIITNKFVMSFESSPRTSA